MSPPSLWWDNQSSRYEIAKSAFTPLVPEFLIFVCFVVGPHPDNDRSEQRLAKVSVSAAKEGVDSSSKWLPGEGESCDDETDHTPETYNDKGPQLIFAS